MRTITSVGTAMSAMLSEKVDDFRGFFGATRRIRTDDLLITNLKARPSADSYRFPLNP